MLGHRCEIVAGVSFRERKGFEKLCILFLER